MFCMDLRKRVKALELAKKQNGCSHGILVKFTFHKNAYGSVEVSATCLQCDKRIERKSQHPKIVESHDIIRLFVEKGTEPAPEKKKK